MRVLVIGKGGREHALAYVLRQSPSVQSIYAIPGNPGIAQIGEVHPEISVHDHQAIVEFCRHYHIDLVVVGPENPLAAGITDILEQAGISVFGPSQAAARLESSKAFAKSILDAAGVPTAAYRVFTAEQQTVAIRFIKDCSFPVVIKADGLAAGKGVVIAENSEEAERTIREFFGGKFGTAGQQIVIEEFLEGFEVSVFAVTDGSSYILLAPAQDHKRAYDGDRGPNTGGMGAYAPTPLVSSDFLDTVGETIVKPVLDQMQQQGIPFKGCLYCGLMVVDGAPYVLEFNVRFGDPEAQVVLPLIEGDFAEFLYSAATGKLRPTLIRPFLSQRAACCVVLASAGYPGSVETGKLITGVDQAQQLDVLIFHAGTRLDDEGRLYTAGGRVLGITALAPSLADARYRAYQAVEKIHFDGKHYRSDIAYQALSDVAH